MPRLTFSRAEALCMDHGLYLIRRKGTSPHPEPTRSHPYALYALTVLGSPVRVGAVRTLAEAVQAAEAHALEPA